MDVPHADGEPQQRSRRIVVGVSGSLGSLAALHRAVSEARRTGDAEVHVVHAWEPPGGEYGYRRSPCPPLLSAVRDTARGRLETALEDAFAGVPTGVRMHAELVRGGPGPVLTTLADDPGDLLVVGTSAGWLHRGMRPSVTAHCTRRAVCPVLVVPGPELQRLMERRRAPWRPRAAWDVDAERAILLPEAS